MTHMILRRDLMSYYTRVQQKDNFILFYIHQTTSINILNIIVN